ncbi:MAG: hypothetical protein ABR508_12530 [Candidatus Baltobacteraceae bacterium]
MSAVGLAGATVVIGGMPPANVGGVAGGSPGRPLPSVTTAADGTFALANVPAGDPCAEGPYRTT